MSCGFDKGLLAAHYDGETTPEERAEVERHLGTCSECARDLESMKRLSGALKPLSKASAPMSIAEGVMREIGTRRSAPRPWLRWTMTAAAALVLAVGTFMFIAPERSRPGTSVETAAKPPAAKPEFHRRVGIRKETADSAPAKQPAASAEPAPAKPPAAPAAEPPGDREELVKMFSNWTGMLFVRVKTPDPATAREIVEQYQAEKQIQPVPDGGAVLIDRYMKTDLTEAETAEVEKRLMALKETTLARTTLEEEKKALGKDDEATLEDSDSSKQKMKESPRGATVRRRVLFIFEPRSPDLDESMALRSELKKEEPPVLRIKAVDIAAVQAEVQAFLKERKLQPSTRLSMIGPEVPAREPYLQVELTAAELKELERRLAAVKETTLVRGSLDEERRKLVDRAKLKAAREDAGKDAPAEADKKEGERVRGAGRTQDDAGPARFRVLLVIEPVETAK